MDTPLNPEERRELVERPFPTIRIIGGSRSWGGTSVGDWFTDFRRRAYTPSPAGRTEWLKYLSDSDS